jgi:hypothetical protein
MRYTLVLLYFTAVYYILRPAVPAGVPENVAAEPVSEPQANLQITPAPARPETTRKVTWQAPVRAHDSADATPRLIDDAPAAQAPSSTLADAEAIDKPGEQLTSTRAAPAPDRDGGDVERSIQNELTRLACLAGKPEKSWGKKSRAALRRFSQRAKTKNRAPRDEALLRTLRGYPANYCKLCKPGEASCAIEATGALPEKADATPRPDEAQEKPAEALSYLPPWMYDKVAKAEDEVGSDALDQPAPKPKKRADRKRRPSKSASASPRWPSRYPSRLWAPWPFSY